MPIGTMPESPTFSSLLKNPLPSQRRSMIPCVGLGRGRRCEGHFGIRRSCSHTFRQKRVFRPGIRCGRYVDWCDVLEELSRSFTRLYAKEGRPSVPPEQLLSAL